MNFCEKLVVPPDTKVRLEHYDPAETFGFSHDKKTKEKLEKTLRRLDDLQYLLYAEKKHALLIVLQGMDAGGKDGTIRHVMSGVNPQGCTVSSFKVPTAEEAAHDFLWRVHKRVPQNGMIGIFNRSHYEDVLVVRVHQLVPKEVWKERYDQINAFEKMLAQNHVMILKFFLHLSKKEQKVRFEEREKERQKMWKLSKSDFAERKYWDDYVAAYEEVLSRCSKKHAPWFIIPADHRWFRNLAVSRILVEVLEGLKMKFPKPEVEAPR